MKRVLLLGLFFAVFASINAQKTTTNSTTITDNWKKEIASNYFLIRVAANPAKYWDLPGHHPKTADKDIQFQIWDKDDDPFERTFTFPLINGTDRFAIKNRAGYIVDVAGKRELSPTEELEKKMGKDFKMKKDNGVEIQTWTLSADGVGEWQQWRIVVVDQHTIMFENAFSSKAIDIKGGNINDNGTKLIQYEKNFSNAQKFSLEYADGPNKGQLVNFYK